MTQSKQQSPEHPVNRQESEGAVVAPRFIPLSDVAEMLSISASQAYALVRSGELRAIKVGGRGQWRVEVTEIESYIERSYAATAQILEEERAAEHPSIRGEV